MEEIIVAIIGGRDFNDIGYFKRCIAAFTREFGKITQVVSGGADGADTLGWLFANKYKISIIEFFPDWDTYGKRAGFLRNEDIIKNSTHVIAFWDGFSKGTKSSIDLAEKYHKELTIYTYTNLIPGYKLQYKNREKILLNF